MGALLEGRQWSGHSLHLSYLKLFSNITRRISANPHLNRLGAQPLTPRHPRCNFSMYDHPAARLRITSRFHNASSSPETAQTTPLNLSGTRRVTVPDPLHLPSTLLRDIYGLRRGNALRASLLCTSVTTASAVVDSTLQQRRRLPCGWVDPPERTRPNLLAQLSLSFALFSLSTFLSFLVPLPPLFPLPRLPSFFPLCSYILRIARSFFQSSQRLRHIQCRYHSLLLTLAYAFEQEVAGRLVMSTVAGYCRQLTWYGSYVLLCVYGCVGCKLRHLRGTRCDNC